MECECGTLHQNCESCRVDLAPLDGDARARVAPGQIGRILATTFENEWYALVRFEIGDVGRQAVEPCPCGRSLGMALSGVEGRLKSLCIAGDGGLVTHARLDQALAGVEGLEQYRVDQVSPVRVCAAVVGEPGSASGVAAHAKGVLAEVFGPRVGIEVEEVPALFAEKSGKFLLVQRSFPLGAAFHV
jgi:phenylacetate-CoA ligase